MFQKLITRIMLNAGYSPYFAYRTFEKIYNDLFHNKNFSLKEKLWAYRRGFLTKHYALHDLTTENYQDFLPLLKYNKLHPINGAFSHWIDDKLTIRYILEPYKQYLPEYYYHIYRNELLKLPDCPEGFGHETPDVLRLLRDKQSLAVKLLAGSSGEGFIKLGCKHHRYSINDNDVEESKILYVRRDGNHEHKSGHLITEFIEPCEALTRIWSNTSNSVRILVIRNKFQELKIAEAFIRFGTINSGVVDNANAGGVACLVNINDGNFSGGIIGRDLFEKIEKHPDTGLLLSGSIPNWSFIKGKVIEISSAIPQVIYMGFDIIVTTDGFKIIEINSHPGIYQIKAPFLSYYVTKDFYNNLFKQKKLEFEHRKNQKLPRRLFRSIKRHISSIKERFFSKKTIL